MTDINFNPSPKDLRIFASLQLIFFVVIALMIWRRYNLTLAPNAIIAMSGMIAILGWSRPALIRRIYVGWMVAVFPIGWVVSHLVLSLVYYLVFTPIGLLLRLAGRDPLHRRFEPSSSTYWIRRRTDIPADRYFRQF